ncbi:MAG: pirin [Segetibacter sp.]|nr:pirin [Segetibacter sp.]
MEQQSKAKMFLAEERGCNETDLYRTYNTFNFENYFNEHKQPFDNLYVLNDQTLAPGHILNINIKESSVIYLLPVVGALSCKDSHANETIANAGQLLVCIMDNSTSLEVSNPYPDQLINFLELRVKTGVQETGNKSELFNFDLDEKKNSLIPVTTTSTAITTTPTQPLISVGKFAGREEAVYKLSVNHNSLFVFIIHGAFEVHGRLLHARDCLGLWNEPGDIELEALSNDAIVLMIELSEV